MNLFDFWSSNAPPGATGDGYSIIVTFTESNVVLPTFQVGPAGRPLGMNVVAVVPGNPTTHTVELRPSVKGVERPGCTYEVMEVIQM